MRDVVASCIVGVGVVDVVVVGIAVADVVGIAVADFVDDILCCWCDIDELVVLLFDELVVLLFDELVVLLFDELVVDGLAVIDGVIVDWCWCILYTYFARLLLLLFVVDDIESKSGRLRDPVFVFKCFWERSAIVDEYKLWININCRSI